MAEIILCGISILYLLINIVVIKFGLVNSKNLYQQLRFKKVCHFRFKPNSDRQLCNLNAALALVPYSFAVLLYFLFSVRFVFNQNMSFCIFTLYCVSCINSFHNFCKEDLGDVLLFVTHAASIIILFILSFTSEDVVAFQFSGISTTLILLSIESIAISMHHNGLNWIKFDDYVEWKKKGNTPCYFRVTCKDGTVYCSNDEFFYPVAKGRKVILYFMSGRHEVLNIEDLEYITASKIRPHMNKSDGQGDDWICCKYKPGDVGISLVSEDFVCKRFA